MPQPPPGEARSPSLCLLSPGRPCEFMGCRGKEGRERQVHGCGAPCSLPSPQLLAGQPQTACPTAALACHPALSPGAPRSPSGGQYPGFWGASAAISHLWFPGSVGPAVRLGCLEYSHLARARAAPFCSPEQGGGTGVALGVPGEPLRPGAAGRSVPGGCGTYGAAVHESVCVPTRTERAGCPPSWLELCLELCCSWNWLYQARSLPWRSRAGDRGRGALRRGPSGFHLGKWRFRSAGPGLRSLLCPSARPSVRPPVEQGAGRAAASLCAVKVGVDARQPRRSCQALSLLAFPSLRPSLRGALLSRSSALCLFTLPGSAAAPGAPAAPTGRGRATGRAVLPSPTGTGPARWQKAGGRRKGRGCGHI